MLQSLKYPFNTPQNNENNKGNSQRQNYKLQLLNEHPMSYLFDNNNNNIKQHTQPTERTEVLPLQNYYAKVEQEIKLQKLSDSLERQQNLINRISKQLEKQQVFQDHKQKFQQQSYISNVGDTIVEEIKSLKDRLKEVKHNRPNYPHYQYSFPQYPEQPFFSNYYPPQILFAYSQNYTKPEQQFNQPKVILPKINIKSSDQLKSTIKYTSSFIDSSEPSRKQSNSKISHSQKQSQIISPNSKHHISQSINSLKSQPLAQFQQMHQQTLKSEKTLNTSIGKKVDQLQTHQKRNSNTSRSKYNAQGQSHQKGQN